MTKREKVKDGMVFGFCPKCGNKSVEEHRYSDSIYTWFFCRECNYLWDDKPKEGEKDD